MWRKVSVCGAVVLLLLSLPVARLPTTLSIDYNEGINTYNAADAVAGRQLYPPGLRAIGYPPLSFYVVGAIGWLSGNQVVAGRAIAFGSLIVSALCAGWIVVFLGGGRDAGALTAIVAIGIVAALAPEYVAMNDHELLARAMMLLALGFYIRRRTAASSGTLVAIAVVNVTALFMKQTVLAVPVAIEWDLWRRSRQGFAIWAAAFVVGIAVAAGAIQIASSGTFLAEAAMPRELVLEHWIGLAGSTLLRLAPLLVVAAPILWRPRGACTSVPALRNGGGIRVYFVASLATGLVFSAGAGTDVNFFFDLFFATAMAVGLSVEATPERSAARTLRLGIVVAFLIVAVPFRMLTPARYRVLAALAADTRADTEFLTGIDGDALCETSLVCFWAGKPFAFDPYLVSEKIIGGRVSEGSVVDLIASGRFRVIQTEAPVPSASGAHALRPGVILRRGRFTENTFAALRQHYRLARTSTNGAFYIPN